MEQKSKMPDFANFNFKDRSILVCVINLGIKTNEADE